MLLAFLLPPLAVYRRDGLGGTFWLGLALTLAFYVPGVLFALWRTGGRRTGTRGPKK